MSSATSITSGFGLPASAISGRYSEAEAQDVAALADVGGLPARALNRQIEARPFASEGNPEAGGQGILRHFLRVQAERQGARSRSDAQRDDPLHDARSA